MTIKERGQVVIILLLVMVVALAIGLSIAGRSMMEIATSTNTENSSRAFSAAEAGIEKALQASSGLGIGVTDAPTVNQLNLENQTQANVTLAFGLPKPGNALELPPFGKESFGQFWLAKPDNLSKFYDQPNFELYFGTPKTYGTGAGETPLEDQPAIEVNVIVSSGSGNNVSYTGKRYFYDSYSVGQGTSTRGNGFKDCEDRYYVGHEIKIKTNEADSPNSSFYCKVTVPTGATGSDYPIMVRVRLLYTNNSHPVALKPTSGSLPAQARIFKSQGSSGNVQRALQVFQQAQVMPQIFDFVLFSAGELNK